MKAALAHVDHEQLTTANGAGDHYSSAAASANVASPKTCHDRAARIRIVVNENAGQRFERNIVRRTSGVIAEFGNRHNRGTYSL